MDSHLYAAHQLFKQIGYPFEWLKLSVKKKMVSRSNGSSCPCKKKIVICLSGSGYLFKKIVSCLNGSSCLCKKKLFSVGTAQAIRWKKLSAIRTAWAINLVREKLATVQKLDPAICLKKNFAGFPFQNNFLTSYLCQMICYSPCLLEWSRYELCLQTYHE